MIYVPNLENFACIVVQSDSTIRAYETMPAHNSTVNYIDYYVNSHYLFKTGSQTYGNTSTIPTCLSSDNLTSSVYYRNDFTDILIIFVILALICLYCPFKLFMRLFKRR